MHPTPWQASGRQVAGRWQAGGGQVAGRWQANCSLRRMAGRWRAQVAGGRVQVAGKWRAGAGEWQASGRQVAGKWQASGRQMRVGGGQASNAVDCQVAGRVVFGVAGMPAMPNGGQGGFWGGAAQSV
jgi:hypothetical protein